MEQTDKDTKGDMKVRQQDRKKEMEKADGQIDKQTERLCAQTERQSYVVYNEGEIGLQTKGDIERQIYGQSET